MVVAADLNSEGSKDYVVSSAGGGTRANALPDSILCCLEGFSQPGHQCVGMGSYACHDSWP